MPDILVAIAKGLAGVPGLAPVFNPLIALREDEKTAKANEVLLEKISEGHEVSREAVGDIVVGILGIREDNQAMRQQMVGGFYAVLKLIQDQQHRIDGLEQQQGPSLSATNLEEEISSLIQENRNVLAGEGLVTRESLRDELVRLFADDVRTLLAIAQPAGFPKGWVATNVKPILAYYDFLEVCEGLEDRHNVRITHALARKMPGSTLLRAWAAMYASYDN